MPGPKVVLLAGGEAEGGLLLSLEERPGLGELCFWTVDCRGWRGGPSLLTCGENKATESQSKGVRLSELAYVAPLLSPRWLLGLGCDGRKSCHRAVIHPYQRENEERRKGGKRIEESKERQELLYSSKREPHGPVPLRLKEASSRAPLCLCFTCATVLTGGHFPRKPSKLLKGAALARLTRPSHQYLPAWVVLRTPPAPGSEQASASRSGEG